MDYDALRVLNDFASRHDWFEDVSRFFAEDAQWFFVALLAVLFLATGKWGSRNARRGVVAAGLAAALALAAAQGITLLWERPRPYEAHSGVHLFVSASQDPSFPSDHATAAFAIAVAVLLRIRPVGVIAIAVAVMLGVARVAVGVHYPLDILGGALLGSMAALVLWLEPVRSWLDALADWAGALYERIIGRLRRPRRAST